MPTTQLTDCRISAAAAVTAGTRTLDAAAIAYDVDASKLGTAVAGAGVVATFDASDRGQHPLVLAQNEGFVVRNKILLGAGGTVRAIVTVDWDELLTY